MRKMGRPKRFRFWAGIGILLVIMLYMVLFYNGNDGDRILLAEPEFCHSQFGPTQDDDIEKIKSYNFPEAEPYSELFSTSEIKENINQSKPLVPVIASAASANHFTEVSKLVESINKVVRPVYKDIKLYLFDLGLSLSQKKQLLPHCNCEIIEFPFDKYPEHVRVLKGYAWKPIAIQLILKYHPFVLWMDASVRFTTNDLNDFWKMAEKEGVLAPVGYGPIAARTVAKTFQFLNEDPCLYKDTNEFEANFIAVYGSTFIRENFMKPWVSCALNLGCMVVDENPENYLSCRDPDSFLYYFHCHRFDQSVMSMLMTRLFHGNLDKHIMANSFFKRCKGGDGTIFMPPFLNDIIFSIGNDCFQ